MDFPSQQTNCELRAADNAIARELRVIRYLLIAMLFTLIAGLWQQIHPTVLALPYGARSTMAWISSAALVAMIVTMARRCFFAVVGSKRFLRLGTRAQEAIEILLKLGIFVFSLEAMALGILFVFAFFGFT